MSCWHTFQARKHPLLRGAKDAEAGKIWQEIELTSSCGSQVDVGPTQILDRMEGT